MWNEGSLKGRYIGLVPRQSKDTRVHIRMIDVTEECVQSALHHYK